MDILGMMRAKAQATTGQPSATAEHRNELVEEKSGKSTDTDKGESFQLDSILSPQWKIHGSHMVTRLPLASSFRCFYKDKLDPDSKKIRVAAFDMDDTLICTKSGIKFGRGPYDWKWRNDQILPALQKKVKDKNMVLVIFTNQSAVSVTELLAPRSKSYKNLSLKVGLIAKALETGIGPIPALFFASTGRPRQGILARSSLETHFSHKKPELGMWSELERYIRRCFGEEYSVDLDLSYFVGDAAGRDGDHLATDKGFAENAGVPFFVPEDYFGI